MIDSFDLTISFDKAEYLNPQLYMMIDTLKDNIPKDTILHVTTNRPESDPVIKYIVDTVPTYLYYKEPFKDLKSRCQYMFHCFEIDTAKEWVIKTEIDVLFLRKLREFNQILEKDIDIAIQPENRRIYDDDILETRLWRQIYRAMNIKMPELRLPYVENQEFGRPLLATGVVAVKSKHLDKINERWIDLTRICERWIDYGIHPNEFAFTGLIFDEEWDFRLYNRKYNFNPIGHFRKGMYPSVKLIDDCKLPPETIVFDYHRPQWLYQVARFNPEVRSIIQRNLEHIPKNWWETDIEKFFEEEVLTNVWKDFYRK